MLGVQLEGFSALNAAAARFIMCVISVLMKPDKLATVQECGGPSALTPHFPNPAHCSRLKVLPGKFFFFSIHLLECAIKEKAFTWTPRLPSSMN